MERYMRSARVADERLSAAKQWRESPNMSPFDRLRVNRFQRVGPSDRVSEC